MKQDKRNMSKIECRFLLQAECSLHLTVDRHSTLCENYQLALRPTAGHTWQFISSSSSCGGAASSSPLDVTQLSVCLQLHGESLFCPVNFPFVIVCFSSSINCRLQLLNVDALGQRCALQQRCFSTLVWKQTGGNLGCG